MLKFNNNPLRDIARSQYWLQMYRTSKELNGISIFDNSRELSRLQIIFLSFLNLYDSLYQDLAMEEDLISEEIIADDIRCDAYLVYKRKNRNKKDKIDKPKNSSGIPSISFVTAKRGK